MAFLIALMTLFVVNFPQQLSTEREQPLLMGMWGLKALLGYLFVMPCVYHLLRDRRDLVLLLRLQTVIVLIYCGLGVAQYSLFRMGICGVDVAGAASLTPNCLVGGAFRYSLEQGNIYLPGTFANPVHWGLFLTSGVFFCFGLTLVEHNRYWCWIAWAAILSILINALVAGQTLALWIIPISTVSLLLGTGELGNWRRSPFVLFGLTAVFILFAVDNPGVVQTHLNTIHQWQTIPQAKLYLGNLDWHSIRRISW